MNKGISLGVREYGIWGTIKRQSVPDCPFKATSLFHVNDWKNEKEKKNHDVWKINEFRESQCFSTNCTVFGHYFT